MLKTAYLLSAYTDPEHLGQLVRQLPPGADCYVHVDANVDIRPFRQATQGLDVRFMERRLHVGWGSFAQVEYQVGLLRTALDTRTDYDFLFVLSAQDYPVWSGTRIERYLQEHTGRNLIQAICMDGQPPQTTRPYREYRLFSNLCLRPGSPASKLRAATRRIGAHLLHKPLAFKADGRTFRLYKGSDYFALNGETAAYVLDEWERCHELRRYFQTGFAPSETFIHTLLFNSPLAGTCIQTAGTYRSLAALTPLTYIDYNPVIKVLTEADYDSIIASGKMFCRKVASGTSDRLVQMLDAHRQKEATLWAVHAGGEPPAEEPDTLLQD